MQTVESTTEEFKGLELSRLQKDTIEDFTGIESTTEDTTEEFSVIELNCRKYYGRYY